MIVISLLIQHAPRCRYMAHYIRIAPTNGLAPSREHEKGARTPGGRLVSLPTIVGLRTVRICSQRWSRHGLSLSGHRSYDRIHMVRGVCGPSRGSRRGIPGVIGTEVVAMTTISDHLYARSTHEELLARATNGAFVTTAMWYLLLTKRVDAVLGVPPFELK